MPDKIIAVESDELGTLYFTSSDYRLNSSSSTERGLTKIGRSDEKTATKFENSLQTIKKVAQKVVDNIRSIEMMPDEVECKIGVTFDAEAGVIFAKVGSECNLELTLKWVKEKPQTPKPQV